MKNSVEVRRNYNGTLYREVLKGAPELPTHGYTGELYQRRFFEGLRRAVQNPGPRSTDAGGSPGSFSAGNGHCK